MSDIPGYARAQAQWEAMEPPSGGPCECPECGGRGAYLGEEDETCSTCMGTGYVDADGNPHDPSKAENDACDSADAQRDERLTNPPDAGDFE